MSPYTTAYYIIGTTVTTNYKCVGVSWDSKIFGNKYQTWKNSYDILTVLLPRKRTRQCKWAVCPTKTVTLRSVVWSKVGPLSLLFSSEETNSPVSNGDVTWRLSNCSLSMVDVTATSFAENIYIKKKKDKSDTLQLSTLLFYIQCHTKISQLVRIPQ